MKILTSLLLLLLVTPSVVEAGVMREGRNRTRCRRQGGVVVCRTRRVRKPRTCGVMPCIPSGYYRPVPVEPNR